MIVGFAVWCMVTAVAAAYMGGASSPATPTELNLISGMGWADSDSGAELKPIDRALLAKAKSHLKLAEIAQEIYVIEAGCYADDLERLRREDPALPDGIEITHSDCTGYTLQIQAGDSLDTILTLKKEWGQSEYHAVAQAPGP